MLPDKSIERVDKFGEKLRDRLQAIGDGGGWGARFPVSKPAASDYYRAQVMAGGQPIKKNWLQLNGHTYFHPSYSSPKPWKLQARFGSQPIGRLWERKPRYVYDRQPQEWSLGGLDVWAVSYEGLDEALSNEKEEDIIAEILQDLRVSWAYANRQEMPQESSGSELTGGRVEVSLSIDGKVWNEFQQVYSQPYGSRRRLPKRPSYAELRDRAVHAALTDYIAKMRRLGPAVAFR